MPEPAASCPAELDPVAYLTDGDAELRRCAAQHWWAQGMDQHGAPMPIVLGWEATRETLSDRRLSPRSFVDDMVASGLSPTATAQITPLFGRHGAEHRHLRAVLSTAFTPRRVEQLRPAARAIAERLVDDIEAGGGACEIVAALAEPLPPEVFALLFGLPVEDRDRMARWAGAIARAFTVQMDPDDVAVVEAATAEMRAYGHERIAASLAAPGDDLVTRLVDAEVDGQRLSDDDVIAMITGFVFAGAETTRRQLTASVAVLAEHPDSWERLAADPSLLPTAVDEILRFRPIVPGLTRRAEEPFTSDDLSLETGDRLLLSFTTANRDPDRFERADHLEIDRPDAHAHVTFGWGPHLCVGAGLARLELTEALGALTARFTPPVVEEAGPIGGFGAPDWLRVRLTRR
ncbi:cytochrome P450 [Iamia sp. SCSIO 61187]|uniref:cytochrome P450 n=1 Tax=Iamia sp. SCSIO 61187 TaxID=2722752 RepID=UPI001C62F2E7|nr:cytochrome P450 [Iamia sp. SCSIO 61187]QYG91969.1 cytochrome P450 [Iamia sp. SCSIO 61187]